MSEREAFIRLVKASDTYCALESKLQVADEKYSREVAELQRERDAWHSAHDRALYDSSELRMQLSDAHKERDDLQRRLDAAERERNDLRERQERIAQDRDAAYYRAATLNSEILSLRQQLAQRRDMTLTSTIRDSKWCVVDCEGKVVISCSVDDSVKLERWSREGASVEPEKCDCCNSIREAENIFGNMESPAPDLAALRERAISQMCGFVELPLTPVGVAVVVDALRVLWLADIDAKLAREEK